MRLLSFVMCAAALCAQAPKSRTDNVEEVLHGVRIVDPYRWLEDQQSPETRAWIDVQNKYTRSLLDAAPGRAELSKRLTELMRIEAIGMPRERGGRYFFTKRAPTQDIGVLYVRKGLTGADEVLIDPHPMSPDHTTTVNLLDVSDDGKTIVYGVRRGGADEIEVRLMDVDSRKDIPGGLPTARYFGVSLTPDQKTLYYSRYTREGARIYKHAIGADPAADEKIFGDGYTPDKGIGAQVTDDGRYLAIVVFYGSSAPKSEVWFQDLKTGGPIRPIVKDIDARFTPDVGGDTMFLLTNWKAPKGRVLAVDLQNPAQERWREVIPESKSILEGISLAGGRICANYLDDVSSRVTVYDAGGKRIRDINVPPRGTVSGILGRWTSDEAFFSYSTFHIPQTMYRYDVARDKRDFWARLKVPVNSEQFELKQVWYKSKDGTGVPMFLLHRKGLKLDGSAPAYLTGYGGFTASMTPSFNTRAVLWAERGGVFALANLRGGGEFGEEWHKAGMLGNKQNVFDDFVGAAEYLIEKGYTNAKRLAIAGSSNGGLLVTAAVTQRPELFGAVICGYPLIDMVRYHKFMLGKFWISEYGSADDPEQFKYIHAYSPYHRVKQGTKYPSVMFVTGDNDTRVAPLHARKMAALMQAATGSDKPILLLYDTASGHSGGRPLGKQIERDVDELSYLFSQLGVK